MSEFNIRLTMRQGDVEKVVEIDCGEPRMGELSCVTAIAGELQPATPALEWRYDVCGGKEVTKALADKAVDALGDGWRLPSLAEQESSRDVKFFNPACDPAKHPNIKPGAYWTSDPYAPRRDFFWVVYFSFGGSFARLRHDNAFVRAVRSLPAGQ